MMNNVIKSFAIILVCLLLSTILEPIQIVNALDRNLNNVVENIDSKNGKDGASGVDPQVTQVKTTSLPETTPNIDVEATTQPETTPGGGETTPSPEVTPGDVETTATPETTPGDVETTATPETTPGDVETTATPETTPGYVETTALPEIESDDESNAMDDVITYSKSGMVTVIEGADIQNIEFTNTYTGNLSPFTLEEGTYQFTNVVINGTSSIPSALTIAEDARVVIYFVGTNTFNGYNATYSVGGGAGINVASGSQLTLRGNGVVNSNGGDAKAGENGKNGNQHLIGADVLQINHGGVGGLGGSGAGAGIGGIGGTKKHRSGDGQKSGKINVSDRLTINATGGDGAKGGNGGSGGESFAVLIPINISPDVVSNGGGGGGGGGGGFPAADIGGGGGSGGDGTDGEMSKSTYKMTMLLGYFGGLFGYGGAGYGGGGNGGEGQGSYAPVPVAARYFSSRISGGSGGEATELTYEDPPLGGSGWKEDCYGGHARYAGLRSIPIVIGGGYYPHGNSSYGPLGGTKNYGGDVDSITSQSGKGGNADPFMYKSELSTINGSYGYGKGFNIDENTVEEQIIVTTYNIDQPGTTIRVNPSTRIYDGMLLSPEISVTSALGQELHVDSYISQFPGLSKNVGEYTVNIEGTKNNSTGFYVDGKASVKYNIQKANRKVSVQLPNDAIMIGESVNLSLLGYDNEGIITWEFLEGNDKITSSITGTTNEYVNITGNEIGSVIVRAKVDGTDNYYDSVTLEKKIEIVPAGAKLFTVEAARIFDYTSHPIFPELIVRYGEDILVQGIDYDLSFAHNVNVGEGVVYINAKGNYEGSKEYWFTIKAADVGAIDFDDNQILQSQIFDGTVKTSVPTGGIFGATNDLVGKEVSEGNDYLISYTDRISAGKVTATIAGIGNFAGSERKMTYDILPADISQIKGIRVDDVSAKTYSGTNILAKPKVYFNNSLLTEDVDYRLEYENNINVGEATVKVFGLKNFSEDSFVSKDFFIIPAVITVVPNAEQIFDEALYAHVKFAGDEEIDYGYSIEGVKGSDNITFKEGTKLSRMHGEHAGQYPVSLGDLALDENNAANKNYQLSFSKETVMVLIRIFEIDAVAKIEGIMGENGWYTSQVQVIAPDGYKISKRGTVDKDDWSDYVTYEDANYIEMSATYYLRVYDDKEDKLSYISAPKRIEFKQDTKNVEGRIILNGKTAWTSFIEKESIAFKTYSKINSTLELYSDDELSGNKEIAYLISNVALSEDNLKKYSDDKWIRSEISAIDFEITDEGSHIIYTRMSDNAGNVDYFSSDGFIIDRTLPQLKTSYSDDSVWTADKNGKVEIETRDILSGIKNRHIDYYYDTQGSLSDIQLLEVDENDKTVITNFPDGDKVLVISVEDNAGNITKNQYNIKKDTVDPIVEVSGDTTKIEPFKDISINANVGPSGVLNVFVQKQEFGVPVEENGTWSDITAEYNTNKMYRVEENGSYYIKYKNGAMVESNIASISFDVIDKTDPISVIEMKINDGNLTSDYVAGTWTNKDVEVAFKNGTNNLGKTNYTYKMSTDNGATYGDAVSITKPDGYITKFKINKTGDFLFDYSLQSEAGLNSDKNVQSIKIDKQRPTGEALLGENKWTKLLHNITFGLFFNSSQEITINGYDTGGSNVSTVEYYILTGDDSSTAFTSKDLEKYIVDNLSAKGDWISSDSDSVNVVLDNPEQCVVYAKITDAAGNVNYLNTDGAILDFTKPIITPTYNNNGEWITDENHEFSFQISDELSGIKEILYRFGTDTEYIVCDHLASEIIIDDIADGAYNFEIIARDNAGNETILTKEVKKDTSIFDINLIGDTKNYVTSTSVTIEPIFGASGIKSIEARFIPKNTIDDSMIAWDNITDSYQSGYYIEENGILYVRATNTIDQVVERSIEFTLIQYIDPVAKIKAINSDGDLVIDENWNKVTYLYISNEVINVSDFTYQYKVGEGPWINLSSNEDGYAIIEADEGENTYYARVRNNAKEDIWSDVVSCSLKIDNTLPDAELFLTLYSGNIWTDIIEDNDFTVAKKDKVMLSLNNVEDLSVSQGIKSVSSYILESDENTKLHDWPEKIEEIAFIDQANWEILSEEQFNKVLNNQQIELFETQENRNYIVYVKVIDAVGNTQYITSEGISIDSLAPVISTDYVNNTWVTDKEDLITVSVVDNLSSIVNNSYTVNDFEGNRIVNYECDENGNIFIKADSLKNGISDIYFPAVDLAGNISEPIEIKVATDFIKPVVVASADVYSENGFEIVNFKTEVGESGFDKLFVEYSSDGIIMDWEEDITNIFNEGYKVKENGTYSFKIINKAGIESEYSTLTFEYLEKKPVVNIKAYIQDLDGNDIEYVEGLWTNSNVRIRVDNSGENLGLMQYEYRNKTEDNSSEWNSIPSSEGEYWYLLKDVGIYELEFRIISQFGAESDAKSFVARIDRERPTFSYTQYPSEDVLTSDDVEITINLMKPVNDALYSFDGGITFQEHATTNVRLNSRINVVVKSASNITSQESISITNIDKLAPSIDQIESSENYISNVDSAEKIFFDVEDQVGTTEFSMSGISKVFLTLTNPYVGEGVRNEMIENDVSLESNGSGTYSVNRNLSTIASGNIGDNCWIVATDNVGNASLTSMRVDENGNIDDGDGDGNGNGDGDKDDNNPSAGGNLIGIANPITVFVNDQNKNEYKEKLEEEKDVDQSTNDRDIIEEMLVIIEGTDLPNKVFDLNDERILLKEMNKLDATDDQLIRINDRFSQVVWAIFMKIIIILCSILLILILLLYRRKNIRKIKHHDQ